VTNLPITIVITISIITFIIKPHIEERPKTYL